VVAVTVEHSDTGSGEVVDETDVGSGVTSSGRAKVVVMTSVEADEVQVSTGLGIVGLADNSEDDDVRTLLDVGTTALDTAVSVGTEGQVVNVRRRSVLVMGVTPGAHALVTGETVLTDEVDTVEDDVSVGRAEQDTSSIPSCKAMVTGTVPEEHPVATGEVEVEVEVEVGVGVSVMVGKGEQYVKGSGCLFGLKLTVGTEPAGHALVAEVIIVADETATDDEDEDDVDEVLADDKADRTVEGEGVVEVRTELLEALPQVPNPD
jgi:hypothetical protein